MRNLTIKRTKTFVACLVKMKIYIEDPTANDLTINNVSCRKLGELKSGEEQVFQIDDRAAKVFVIADNLSKNYCNEYCQLPEGQEDIVLSGKNKFNLANGNAFRFDQNDNPEVLANRKRGTRKGLIILIVSVVVGALLGYFLTSGLFREKEPKEKDFSADGMTITLTDEFKPFDTDRYTVAYESKTIAVYALKESFSAVQVLEAYTLDQYAELLIQANKKEDSEVKKADGLTYYEYEYTSSDNQTYHYFTYVYKTDDAFWVVQFATPKKLTAENERIIEDFAKSVEFKN